MKLDYLWSFGTTLACCGSLPWSCVKRSSEKWLLARSTEELEPFLNQGLEYCAKRSLKNGFSRLLLRDLIQIITKLPPELFLSNGFFKNVLAPLEKLLQREVRVLPK